MEHFALVCLALATFQKTQIVDFGCQVNGFFEHLPEFFSRVFCSINVVSVISVFPAQFSQNPST